MTEEDRAAGQAFMPTASPLPDESHLPQEIFDRLARCPLYIDVPTAWAIQHSHGDKLEHHPRCSSVPGWHALSGGGFLCDCSAMEDEWRRIAAMPRAAQAIEARRAETLGSVHESAVHAPIPASTQEGEAK